MIMPATTNRPRWPIKVKADDASTEPPIATAVSSVRMTMVSMSSATSRPITNRANGSARNPLSDKVRVATMVEDSAMMPPRNSASLPCQPNASPRP